MNLNPNVDVEKILEALKECKTVDEMNKVLVGTGITLQEKSDGDTSCEVKPEGKPLWEDVRVQQAIVEQHKSTWADREQLAKDLADLARRAPHLLNEIRGLSPQIANEAKKGESTIIDGIKAKVAAHETNYEATAAPIRAERLRRKAEAAAKRAPK